MALEADSHPRTGAERMKIELPDYCCPPTFRLKRAGDETHDHQWDKIEHDDWVEWNCSCGARATCEVYQ